MPKAIRLSQLPNTPSGMRSTIRAALCTLWTIEGHVGIFFYAQGCKADYIGGDGEIVAEITEDKNGSIGAANFAIFKRDESVEFVVKQALGVDDKTVANAIMNAVANIND